ncbi:MAG: GNAT family N-acetyltransferase [bacterium]|nr:GNAT family N-acetyltransferase [bacterium]
MPNAVRLLEELSFRTLPALDQDRYDGWVLRWSDGGSRRANSVNAVRPSTLPIADKIRHCEDWFAARGAPPVFRVTPLADEELDGALADHGYGRSSPTAVMTAALKDPTADNDVVVADSPSQKWLQCIASVSGEPQSLDGLRHQLTSSGGHNRFASVSVGGQIVAIGMSLDLDGFTTVYNMNTVPERRRRGYARRILSTLLAKGIAAGTDRAVLQVTWENAAAMALYSTVGFSPAYSYHYRELPPT